MKESRIAAGLGTIAAGGLLALAAWAAARLRGRGRPAAGDRKIVILGAGFAGMSAARELARRLPREDGQIVLLDQHNFLLFTPMLTEAAGGQVDARHIVAPIRALSPRVTFQEGRIEHIDLAAREVRYVVGAADQGVPEARRTVQAEHLVLALGSVVDFHGIPGLREHSLGLKSVAEAAALRDRAVGLLERADGEPDPATRRALLTFVVGGGGYTGVETMAALNDLVRGSLARYPRLRQEDVRCLLVEPSGRLLHELTPDLAAYAQRKLEARRVEVLLKTKITAAGEGHVELDGQRRIPTQALIWAAGVTASPAIASLPCRRGKRGRIVVDEHCAVPGHPGVWAVGDCAAVPQEGRDEPYAPTAQNATREGALVARNIVASLRGGPPRPFRYRPAGQLALVGRRSGVALVYGLRFSGLVAWALWRAVYLFKMPGLRQRARVGLDWLLDLVFGREATALLAPPRSLLPAHGGAA